MLETNPRLPSVPPQTLGTPRLGKQLVRDAADTPEPIIAAFVSPAILQQSVPTANRAYRPGGTPMVFWRGVAVKQTLLTRFTVFTCVNAMTNGENLALQTQ